MKAVTFDEKSGLFTIPEASGYSCLGLEVCWKRASRLAWELGEQLQEDYKAQRFENALALYADYCRLTEIARKKHEATGWRSQSELTEELKGLEGKRVEVVHQWPSGEVQTSRFWVGRSTGWLPVHLAIARRNCYGGPAVSLGRIQSIRIVRSA